MWTRVCDGYMDACYVELGLVGYVGKGSLLRTNKRYNISIGVHRFRASGIVELSAHRGPTSISAVIRTAKQNSDDPRL